MTADLRARADNERRLGLLILENKAGAALAAGIPHLRSACELWQQLGSPLRKAQCLCDLGRLHDKRASWREGADAWLEAWSIYSGNRMAKESCDAAGGAGRSLLALGEADRAAEMLDHELRLAAEINDHMRLAQARLASAACALVQHRAEQAIEHAGKALDTFRNFRQGLQVAKALACLAEAEDARGAHAAADGHDAAATQEYLDLGRTFEACEHLSKHAGRARARGDIDLARELLDRCRILAEQAGIVGLLGQALRLLGQLEQDCGRSREALALYARSRDLCAQDGDRDGLARSLYLIGGAHLADGDPAASRSAIEACLKALDASGDPRVRERALAALAKLHRRQGDHEAALATMQEWVTVLKDIGDRRETLRVLGRIAAVHEQRGATIEAEEHLRRLISVCTEPADSATRAEALHQLAVLLARRDEHAEAIGHYADALDLWRELGDEAQVRRASYQYGSSLLQLQRADEAKRVFSDCIAEHERAGEVSALARVLVGMGNAWSQLGDQAQARACFERAATLCEQQGDIRATAVIRRATES